MTLRLLALVWFLLMAAPALRAAEEGMKISEAKIRETIQAVITEQLGAFRAGDYKTAYGFADQAMKEICTLAMFEEMVKKGYPAIAANVSARCGLTLDDGTDAQVTVRILGKDAQSVDYRYTLHFDGKVWRITGVVLAKDVAIEA